MATNRIPRTEVIRARVGMREAEWETLTAILSAWNLTRKPVTRPQLHEFMRTVGAHQPCTGPLEKRGWIEGVARVKVSRCSWATAYAPTARGYRFLGFEPPRAAKAA
jgi:hypothetical protein